MRASVCMCAKETSISKIAVAHGLSPERAGELLFVAGYRAVSALAGRVAVTCSCRIQGCLAPCDRENEGPSRSRCGATGWCRQYVLWRPCCELYYVSFPRSNNQGIAEKQLLDGSDGIPTAGRPRCRRSVDLAATQKLATIVSPWGFSTVPQRPLGPWWRSLHGRPA